jgi:hypothetical protein
LSAGLLLGTIVNAMDTGTDCVFCGGKPLSKEHIFADWMADYIPRTLPRHRLVTTVVFDDRTEERTRRREGDPHTRTVRCVCEPCNNGWMSRLQEEAKPIVGPMLQGRSARLNRREQAKLASWAAMMVMVAEFMDRNMVAVPQHQRNFLRREKRIPTRWRVLIASREPSDHSRFTHHALALTKPGQKIEPAGPHGVAPSNTQTSTICLGEHLVVHVISSNTVPDIIQRWEFPDRLAPALKQIWPIVENDVSWPLAETLHPEDLAYLAEVFFETVQAVHRRHLWEAALEGGPIVPRTRRHIKIT